MAVSNGSNARVEWEDFRSLIDTAPALVQLFADHIEGAAGEAGKLRDMIKNGELAGRDLAKVLIANADEIDRTYQSMPRTVGAAFAGLGNVLSTYVSDTNDASGVGRAGQGDRRPGRAKQMRGDFQHGAAAVIDFFVNIRSGELIHQIKPGRMAARGTPLYSRSSINRRRPAPITCQHAF